MIVVFDFDGVADKPRIHRLVRKFIIEKNEVWIMTMRSDNEYNRSILFPILKKIGLSPASVIYTNEKPKIEFLQAINADLYIDNIGKEFQDIKNHTNTIPVLYHD